ncbi:MAG: TVP38/TMEM64 family protein [Alphaproteobacteria bacterium]
MTETRDSETSKPERKSGFSAGRVIPLVLLAAGLAAFFAFDLNQYVSLEALKTHRETLQSWVQNYGVMTAAVFMLIYALAVAFSVPGAVFITIAGGFMFGPYLGTVYVVVGATVGAVGVFLAAKYALGDVLRARAGPAIKRMEAGFRENEMSYLLILRLVPLFPFWLVNLVPAFLGVSLRTYTIGTLLGIIPGAFVYALVGDGAGAVLDAGGDLNLGIIFEPRFLAPIIGLAVLACIPIVYKKVRGRKDVPSS